ncbi:hypothetical protein LCGC14_2709940, partial [marine sediment metagenome]
AILDLSVLVDGTNALSANWNAGSYYITASGFTGVSSSTNELTCTDCINATEIEDIYFLTVGDVITGSTTINHNLTVGTSTALYVDSGNGRVGIGMASPSSALHIKANVSGVFGQLIIQSPTNSVNTNVAITAYESDGSGDLDQQLWYLGSSAGANANITFLNKQNGTLTLGTNNTTRLTIAAAGNVGIGTSTPSYLLTVGTTVGDNFIVDTSGNATTSALGIRGLANCDTIDTDANGVLSCGSDDTGGAFATTTADYWGSQRAGDDISWSSGFNLDDPLTITGLNVTYSTTTGTLVIPTSADPTINVYNNLSINTTQASTSIRYFDGTNEMVLSPVFEKSYWLASTTIDLDSNKFEDATTTHTLWNPAKAVTLVGLYGKTDTGTLSFKCGDGTNYTESIVATSSGVEDDGSMTNNTFTMREDFVCQVGSAATS